MLDSLPDIDTDAGTKVTVSALCVARAPDCSDFDMLYSLECAHDMQHILVCMHAPTYCSKHTDTDACKISARLAVTTTQIQT